MQLLSATDQRFYALVHQALAANDAELSRSERRSSARRRYPCLQWVAPYHLNALPTDKDFVHVQCEDISPGGFSFFDELESATWANSPQLIVALGFSQPLYLVAEIVRRRPLETPLGNRTLFGCRFLARIIDANYCPILGELSTAAAVR